MATMAAYFRRPAAATAADAVPREYWNQEPDPFQLRPLPCEDVYLYCKKVDNSRVVREADPIARKKCWRAVSASFAAALFLMFLMLPDALGMIAGYQIHSLARDREKLTQDLSRLELGEASLLSPQRLQELARDLRLVDPDSTHVVYINSKTDSTVALNVGGK
jgi:cell division protein FtsL